MASITEVQSRVVDLKKAKQTTRKFYTLLTENGRKPRPDDLILSRNATVGEVAVVTEAHPEFALGQDVCLLRKKSSGSSTGFLQSAFRSRIVAKQLSDLMVGSTFKRVNIQQVKNIVVPMPPPEEQEAIAKALSDADTLIESFEQLIAKKRNLKQGATQKLFRSRNGWVKKKLSAAAPLQRGFDLPNRLLKKGPYPVIYSNGVLNHHERFAVKAPGVVTGRSGTLGSVQFISEDYWPHNTTLWVTDFKGNDPKFVYYLYAMIGLEKFGTGSGVPTLNRNDVHDFLVTIPESPQEQANIAEILTDMDEEIVAIGFKLQKACQIKQGIMRNLLTGNIRLAAEQ